MQKRNLLPKIREEILYFTIVRILAFNFEQFTPSAAGSTPAGGR